MRKILTIENEFIYSIFLSDLSTFVIEHAIYIEITNAK